MSVPTPVTSFDLTRTFTLDAAGKDQPIDRAKLVTMAQEFESMLLLQMVRQMRQSMLMDEEEDTGLGNTTMTDTFDVEFARYLAKQGGIGLSKAIEQQFEKSDKGKADATAATGAEADAAAKAFDLYAQPSFAVARPVAPSAGTAFGDTAPAGKAPAGKAPAGTTVSPVKAHEHDAAGHDAAAHGAAGYDAEETQDLVMPLDSDTSSAFGWRNDPFKGRRKFHNGVDLRAAYGTEVPTAAPGKVTYAGERGAYGLMVVVEHPNGVETRYAHLSSTAVQPGDSVAAGQTIGRVGSTGRSTAPHLHFEVLLDGKRVNPEQMASSRQAGSILPQAGSTLAP